MRGLASFSFGMQQMQVRELRWAWSVTAQGGQRRLRTINIPDLDKRMRFYDRCQRKALSIPSMRFLLQTVANICVTAETKRYRC